MEPLAVVVAGLAALAGAAIVLRTFGLAYRVGRLLASAPRVTIEDAERIAASGRPRYVRIDGRLDSAHDFPDEYDRPLVYRRRRLEILRSGRWAVIDDDRQVVPFEIRDGLATIAIDGEQLGEGLVVIPRESLGSAADVPDRVPADTPPATPVRLRIEQVSSVEHATVLGVPQRRSDGTAMLSAGLGRPLILSAVEQAEAMQLLAGGQRRRPLAVLVLIVAGLALLAIGLAWWALEALAALAVPGLVLAATPSATPAAGGDTRSAGEGPGLVGSPVLALALVALIAIVTVALTLAYVRLTARPSDKPPPRT